MKVNDSLFAQTAIVFGLITVAVYVFFIRPLLPTNQRRRQAAPVPNRNSDSATAHGAPSTSSAASGIQGSNEHKIPCSRVPSHVSSASAAFAVNGGSNLLVDGIIAFKHSRASDEIVDESDRTVRAKILSNLLDGSTVSVPPAKGSAVVVAIPVDSVACPYQRRVLVLLATYYNLLVLLAVPQNETFTEDDKLKAVATLRGNGIGGSVAVDNDDNDEPTLVAHILTEEALPTHRIPFASTVTGRVAFVRQLQRVELVLDFDPEVLALLSRFGHRVVVYGANDNVKENGDLGDKAPTVSKLGRAMI